MTITIRIIKQTDVKTNQRLYEIEKHILNMSEQTERQYLQSYGADNTMLEYIHDIYKKLKMIDKEMGTFRYKNDVNSAVHRKVIDVMENHNRLWKKIFPDDNTPIYLEELYDELISLKNKHTVENFSSFKNKSTNNNSPNISPEKRTVSTFLNKFNTFRSLPSKVKTGVLTKVMNKMTPDAFTGIENFVNI